MNKNGRNVKKQEVKERNGGKKEATGKKFTVSHSCCFQPFSAIPSHTQPFPAMSSHFQPFSAIPAIPRHFQTFPDIASHFSLLHSIQAYSIIFQPIFSLLQPFQPFPAISSHIQPFQASITSFHYSITPSLLLNLIDDKIMQPLQRGRSNIQTQIVISWWRQSP